MGVYALKLFPIRNCRQNFSFQNYKMETLKLFPGCQYWWFIFLGQNRVPSTVTHHWKLVIDNVTDACLN